MLVFVKDPGMAPVKINTGDSDQLMWSVLGQNLERVDFGDGIVLVMNARGYEEGLDYNFGCDDGISVFGSVLFIGEDEDGFSDLTPVQQSVITGCFPRGLCIDSQDASMRLVGAKRKRNADVQKALSKAYLRQRLEGTKAESFIPDDVNEDRALANELPDNPGAQELRAMLEKDLSADVDGDVVDDTEFASVEGRSDISEDYSEIVRSLKDAVDAASKAEKHVDENELHALPVDLSDMFDDVNADADPEERSAQFGDHTSEASSADDDNKLLENHLVKEIIQIVFPDETPSSELEADVITETASDDSENIEDIPAAMSPESLVETEISTSEITEGGADDVRVDNAEDLYLDISAEPSRSTMQSLFISEDGQKEDGEEVSVPSVEEVMPSFSDEAMPEPVSFEDEPEEPSAAFYTDRESFGIQDNITVKGSVWFEMFLDDEMGSSMSREVGDGLKAVLLDRFRKAIEDDKDFSEAVRAFVGTDRSETEKEHFFHQVMQLFVKAGGIKEDFAKRQSKR